MRPLIIIGHGGRYNIVVVSGRHIAAFSLALLPLTARAQYDVAPAHYWQMEAQFNPAAAGKEDKINVAAAYQIAMAGFEHCPKTMYAGADMPFEALRMRHAAAAQFTNDEIGLFSHKQFALAYALGFRLFGGRLQAGVRLGMLSESFDGSKVDTETPSDPAFPSSEVSGTGFDIGAGLYYLHRSWYAGLSATHLTQPKVKLGERQELDVKATYWLTGGCALKLRNPRLRLLPSCLARTDGVAWRADLTARLQYSHDGKMLYAGASYSPTNSATVLIGGFFHGIILGYSYEIYTSAISPANGSHELSIGYQTDLNFGKKGRNRHQSVRTL